MVARTRSAAAHPPAPASTPHLVVDPASDPRRPDELNTTSMDSSWLRRRPKRASSGASSSGGSTKGEADERQGSSVAAEEDDDGAAMLRCGIALVVGSATSFALGLWTMLVGPLCAPTGIKVRSLSSSLARGRSRTDARLSAAARRARAGHALQVPRRAPRARDRVLRHRQLVGAQGASLSLPSSPSSSLARGRADSLSSQIFRHA